MKKIINKILLFIVTILTLIFTNVLNINALNKTQNLGIDNISFLNITDITPSKDPNYKNYDYVIDNYDININVNENNTFDITETITAYFNIPKHGIFRTIPVKNVVSRLDGTTSTVRAKISNIYVDNEYKLSRENGNYKLRIGSANQTMAGKQEYTIKYTYNLGKDPSKDYDELYYNIIGKDWDTVIGNITFMITMPKEFDASKIGFSSGKFGSTDNAKVKYTVSDNKIIGSYTDILNNGEALTIRCELPEGYFANAKSNLSTIDYALYLIPILFLIISVGLWYKFGRNEKVIETVEFYPPYGLNSLEVGFLYKGKAEDKDITSLLVYLANKGYLEIINKNIDLSSNKISVSQNVKDVNQKVIELENKLKEEKSKDPYSKKIKYYENMLEVYKNIDTPIDYEQYGLKSSIKSLNKKYKFLIRKIKDYDGNNINEKWFMEGLFKYNRTEVTDKMLYNDFYITNDKIKSNINNEENMNKVFEKSSSNKKIFIILMIIISYILITAVPLISYGQFETIIIALIFTGIGFSTLLSGVFSKEHIPGKVTFIVWGLFFGGIPWGMFILPALFEDKFYLLGYFIGIVSIMVMIFCTNHLQKRTKYGNEMLGKLKGFKNFLKTVEKEKLEALVMENPNYFYDILPYTYVLGVSNKWIKKFELISVQEPSWYDSNSFDIHSFGTYMNSTINSAQSAMSSVPFSSLGGSSSGGSSSGGSSSGGGSSGGGSGGGGGSSW